MYAAQEVRIHYKLQGGGGPYGFNMVEKAMSFWREDAICAVIPSRI